MKKNLFRFCIIGGCTTVIDWCIYWLMSKSIDVSLAKICSMLLVSIFSYFFNKFWTFENVDKEHKRYIWRYYITFVINIMINTSINTGIYKVTGKKILALFIATGCATIVNFLLQRFWVFKCGERRKIK